MWPGIHSDVEILVDTLPKCQNFNRITNRAYVNFIFCEPGVIPCNTTHVEILVPFTVYFNTEDFSNL